MGLLETVAAPARVAGQLAADRRGVAAELLPWRSIRRFPSGRGSGNVPGRSGDGSLWAWVNLRFGLTIRIA